jgi:hypothetical protein
MHQPDRLELFADIRAFLAQQRAAPQARAELERLQAAWQRPPTLMITVYARPSRWQRVWRWLRRRRG